MLDLSASRARGIADRVPKPIKADKKNEKGDEEKEKNILELMSSAAIKQGGADAAVSAALGRVNKLLDSDAALAKKKEMAAARVHSCYTADEFKLCDVAEGGDEEEGGGEVGVCVEDERDCSTINSAVCCVLSFSRISRPGNAMDLV